MKNRVQVLTVAVVIGFCVYAYIAEGNRETLIRTYSNAQWTASGNDVWLEYQANPMQLDSTNLNLQITDPASKPVSDCKVFAELTMPSMSMPENVTELSNGGNGHYAAMVKYTMSGSWKLHVRIERQNRQIMDQQLDITVH